MPPPRHRASDRSPHRLCRQLLQEPRWLALGCSRQFSIPCLQGAPHLAARAHQGSNLLIGGSQDTAGGLPHVITRLPAGVAHTEEPGQLLQREAKSLGVAYDGEPVHHAVGVLSIAGRRPRRTWHDANALVVANGVRRDSRESRDFSDCQHGHARL